MSVSITIKDAVKRYGSNTIIKDLSVSIKGGANCLPCWTLPAAEKPRCCA